MDWHNTKFLLKSLPIALIDLAKISFGKQNKYRSIQRFKNIHKGKRCFFIGTGPSLTIDDVEKLRGEIVFLCNYGAAMLEQLSYKPEYYIIADPECYRDIKKYINNEKVNISFVIDMLDSPGGITELINDNSWVHLPAYRAFYYIERGLNKRWSFSFDPSKCLFSGGSVIYYCYQLAVYMGFSEIYLLGMDCDYSKNEVHYISVNTKTDSKLRNNAKWYGNSFIKMHSCAGAYCAKKHIRVVNSTRGGNLECFERIPLEEILSPIVKVNEDIE